MAFADRIAGALVNCGATAENKELYAFGLRQGGFMLLNAAATLAIGLALEMVWQSILFSLAYIPLRTFAGGYHAKTPLRCFILSNIMVVTALLGIRLVQWNSFICAIIGMCAGLIVFLLAPVEDRNKPLDQKEQSVYKKRARIILCVLFVIALSAWLLGQLQITSYIVVAVTALCVMLVLGNVKNKL